MKRRKSIPFAILGGMFGYGLACYHGVKVVGWVLGGVSKALGEEREKPVKRSYSSYGSYGYRPTSYTSYSGYKMSTNKETKQTGHIGVRRSGRYTWGEEPTTDEKEVRECEIKRDVCKKVAEILKEQGMATSYIARVLAIHESSVRSLLGEEHPEESQD